jgi:hypothetical protein
MNSALRSRVFCGRCALPVKFDRDLLIYITWQLEVVTNLVIGEKFGLTYSAVSQRASVIKKILSKVNQLELKYRCTGLLLLCKLQPLMIVGLIVQVMHF